MAWLGLTDSWPTGMMPLTVLPSKRSAATSARPSCIRGLLVPGWSRFGFGDFWMLFIYILLSTQSVRIRSLCLRSFILFRFLPLEQWQPGLQVTFLCQLLVFMRPLCGKSSLWFSSLEWFQGCSPGDVCDISWVELFSFWIVDTGCVPPFRVDGRWVRVGEDDDAICCIPSAYTLYKTWRRAVSFVLRSGNLVPGAPVSSAVSAVGLGARFAVPGLTWRPRVPFGVRRDLAFQFASLRSLASLRLPPLW